MVDRDMRKSERDLIEQEGLLKCRCEEEWETPSETKWFTSQGGDTNSRKKWDVLGLNNYIRLCFCNILYHIMKYSLLSMEVDMISLATLKPHVPLCVLLYFWVLPLICLYWHFCWHKWYWNFGSIQSWF